MKSSIHLFYGIIIGILATLCMGSLKTDMKEFKEEKIVFSFSGRDARLNEELKKFKEEGWTIIDWEMDKNWQHFFHLGK